MRRVAVLILASLFAGLCPSIPPRTSTSAVILAQSNLVPKNGASPNGAPRRARVIFPAKEGSVRFAIIGDMGTGSSKQQELADMMVRYREIFPFEFVLMLGDNLYGGENAEDFVEKFETPYKQVLAGGVTFYAALGNHDNPNQRFYKNFNMEGKEYYTFKRGNARFFALNSCYMDARQLKWLDEELKKSKAEWKICFFHHPLYSSGKKHGPDDELRKVLEPLFVKYGVAAVFAGHEHFYERFKPQKGIFHFISGAGGKLRRNGLVNSGITAKSFDQDLHFVMFEIVADTMYFQVISRSGETVDEGALEHPQRRNELAASNE